MTGENIEQEEEELLQIQYRRREKKNGGVRSTDKSPGALARARTTWTRQHTEDTLKSGKGECLMSSILYGSCYFEENVCVCGQLAQHLFDIDFYIFPASDIVDLAPRKVDSKLSP